MATATQEYRVNAGFNDYIETIQALSIEFLTELKEEFIAYLAANNRNATGKSSASLQVIPTDTGGQLVGGNWIYYTFTGRAPGQMPPISAIIDWLNARGLPRAMAWNVAKKIAREGTDLFQQGGRNNNAFTEILTQERIDEFAKNISNLVAVEINSGIMEAWAA